MLQHKPFLALSVSSEINKIQLFLLKGFCIQELIFSLVESALPLAKDSKFSKYQCVQV